MYAEENDCSNVWQKVYYWGTIGKECHNYLYRRVLPLFYKSKIISKYKGFQKCHPGISHRWHSRSHADSFGPGGNEKAQGGNQKEQIQNLSLDCLDSKLGPAPPEVSEPYSMRSSLTDRRVWRKGRDMRCR